MFVHLDLAGVFQLFCLVQGLTTAAYLLFFARPRAAAPRWLGLLLLALTAQVLDYFLSRAGVYFRHRDLYFTPLFFSWSFGPLLLAYVRARTQGSPLRAAHWLPGLVQVLFYGVLAGQDIDTKTTFWLTVHKPVTRYVEHYGALLSLVLYAWLALHRLHLAPSPLMRGLRLWLRLLIGFGAAAALDPLINRWYLPAGAPLFYLSSLGLPVLTYGLVLFSGRRSQEAGFVAGAGPEAGPEAGARLAETPVPALPPAGRAVPAAEAVIDPAQLAAVVRALEEAELYKDSELTLDGLARHVSLTPNTVSQLLNTGLGQSFSEVVNGYRLADVKRRLLTDDARRFTVLALAFDAGFNSKATFNRIFKEKTGLTPSAYRKASQLTP